jgi:LacI family transcriptional regulator, galactose operon repressor
MSPARPESRKTPQRRGVISSLELARICGVSQGTVDRALHNRKGISAATRERILEQARLRGYAPNPAVREIMGGASRFVGAILPALNSVFFMDLMNALESALASRDMQLVLAPRHDSEGMLKMAREFAARRYRALVVVPPSEHLEFPEALIGNLPVFSLLVPVKAGNSLLIGPDEVGTGRRAAEYLLARGHVRIAHLSYARDSAPVRDRARGFSEAMRAAGAKPVTLVANPERLQLELPRGVSAIFCHNDWLALKAIRALSEQGLSVPGDVSVMGVDNSPSFVELYPDLTTMEYPREFIAGEIAAILAGEKQTPAPAPDMKIIERGTVGSS